jgi:hypothetical protein
MIIATFTHISVIGGGGGNRMLSQINTQDALTLNVISETV